MVSQLAFAAEDRHNFVVAANLPWRFYGDTGGNAWGHRGFSTEGFVAQGGFTRVKWAGPALVIEATNLSSGEVTTSLADNYPFPCRKAPGSLFNLEGVTSRMRLCLPPGSAGAPGAPNGVQFVFRSESGSLYSPWVNVEPAWEGSCTDLSFLLSNSGPGDRFGAFDAARIAEAGFKLAAPPSSNARLTGAVLLERFAIEADPALVFDFTQSRLDQDFEAIRDLALKMDSAFPVARVFLFVDGRAGIEWAPDGTAIGLDAHVLDDFDALAAAAERSQVLLQPVLLDFYWCSRAKLVGGVQLGGHSDVIRDPVKRQSFLERVLAPLLDRYGSHPSIFAWEAGNELEWVTDGVPGFSPDPREMDPVSLADMQEFVRQFAALVRNRTRHHATTGSARRAWAGLWNDLGLTLHNFHYYDSDRGEPFPWRPSAELKLDAPVMVAEVPTAGTSHAAGHFLRAAREGGYAGLYLWSCRARDAFSDYPAAAADLASRVPAASLDGLANAASFAAAAPLAPETWFSLFGLNLAPSTTAAPATPLPSSLDGTAVTLTDGTGASHPASLLFVSPGQINFLTPPGLAGPATLTVSRLDGGSAAFPVEVAPLSPGLFSANADGRGVAAAVAVRVRGGQIAGSDLVFRCDAAAGGCQPVPVDLGPEGDEVILLLFGTGIRHGSAAFVWIGGQELAPSYFGPQNEFAGLDQVNVPLPRSLAGRGEVEIVLSVDGRASNPVTVQIQ